MKRLLKGMMALLPVAMLMVSCDDDKNEMPDVSVKAEVSGGVVDDGAIYITQGEELNINSITLTNRTGKDAALGAVTYYWDHTLVGTVVTKPFELTIETSEQPVGHHLLQAEMPIYVVDYPLVTGLFEIDVVIVPADEELPGEGDSTETVSVGGVIQTS